MHAAHPTFILQLLETFTMTHKYKHTIYESHREICGCMHARAHTAVRRVQSPRVMPESARGSLLAAPTCPHPKPRLQGRAFPPGGPPGSSDVGHQAEGVHMRMCVCALTARRGCCRPGPVLGPDPSLVKAGSQSPHPLFCPSLSEPPRLDSALPTGALTGSVPRPTQTLTQDKDRCRVGRAPQTRAAAAHQGACCGQPAQGSKSSFWLLGRVGKVSGGSRALRPQPGGSRSCGQLATAAWFGYMAQVCTWQHIRGYVWEGGWATLHRTDTQSSR